MRPLNEEELAAFNEEKRVREQPLLRVHVKLLRLQTRTLGLPLRKTRTRRCLQVLQPAPFLRAAEAGEKLQST